MAKLMIQTTPQALSPGTTGGSVILYNEGPDTFYLGTDGTVDPTRDLPVPPLTYVPWPTGVASWAVSRGTSNVRLINTYESPSINTSPRQQVITSVAGQISAAVPNAIITVHPIVECASYQTLRVQFYSSVTFDMVTPGFNCYEVALDWYSTDNVFIGRDTYSVGFAASPSVNRRKPVTMTVPVKGSLVQTRITNNFTGNYLTDFTLMGLTDSRPISLTPSYSTYTGGGTSGDTEVDCPIMDGGGGGAVITNREWGEDWAQFVYTTLGQIAFHAKSRYLRVAFAWNAAPAAGSLVLRDLSTQSIISANYALDPTKTRMDYDILVPRSRQCSIGFVGAPATLGTATLTWYD